MSTATLRNERRKSFATAQYPRRVCRSRVKTRTRVLLLGAKGRMGQAIAASAPKAEVEITAGLDLGDDVAEKIQECDVVIDFSHPNSSGELARNCRIAKKPAVIGTTGHSQEERAVLADLA